MVFDIPSSVGIILLATTLFCVITDFVNGKIYNSVTFSIIGVGLLYHSFFAQGHGFQFSILGVALGFALFFSFFALQAMGAGDVKLLMAIGALTGWRFTLGVAILSFLAGGVISIFLLIKHERFKKTLKSIGTLLWTMVVPEMKMQTPKIEDCLLSPFALPLFIGVVLQYFKFIDIVSLMWKF
ncbi:MAG: prepilin peptidase [Deltaproteobacteria bacterium]|nr:prepilin peptidase [Deltaproteobacteria bacterium]